MTSFAEVTHAARAIFTEDDGRLWGFSLADVDWMGFDDDGIHLTADPERPGYVQTAPGLWSGPTPDGVPRSSTPITWAGRRWAGLLFPLPDDDRGPVREAVHEAWHIRQERAFSVTLPSDTSCPGADLLDTAYGRTWLRLEVSALHDALLAVAAANDRWRVAAADALLFRRRRLAVTTEEEANRERDLDVFEGVAEYTAWRLTDTSATVVASRTPTLPTGDYASWVRYFPYHTGPAYGYLLDRAVPGWRTALRDNPDLQGLLALALAVPSFEETEVRACAYGIETIRMEEQQREDRRQSQLDTLRKQFRPSAVLRLKPDSMAVTFNPGEVIPLDEKGTVYHRFTWRYADGSELQAARVMLTPDWKEMWLPLDETTRLDHHASRGPGMLTGAGWTLTLAAGWRIRQDKGTWIAAPDN